MTYEITKEQVDAFIKYLYTRPYGEVAEGVKMLQSLPEVERKEKK